MRHRLVLVLALGSACGGHATAPQAPHEPSPAVRSDIDAAETAERARQHDVARERYQRAVTEAGDAPSIAYARKSFGETLASWGEYAEAIAQYQGAIAAAPTDAQAWHDLGVLYEKQQDDRALAAVERSHELAPRDIPPLKTLALLYWKHGNYAAATTTYKQLLDLDIPDGLRRQVEWALDQLARPNGGRVLPGSSTR